MKKCLLLSLLLPVAAMATQPVSTQPVAGKAWTTLPSPATVIVKNDTNEFTGIVSLGGPDVLETTSLTQGVPVTFHPLGTFPNSYYFIAVSTLSLDGTRAGMVQCHQLSNTDATFQTKIHNSGSYEIDIISTGTSGPQDNLKCVFKKLS